MGAGYREAQASGGPIVVAKASPAPAPLATPTDLTIAEAQAVAEAINSLIAGLFAHCVKTKTYHWRLARGYFYDYHLLFDEQGDQIFATG